MDIEIKRPFSQTDAEFFTHLRTKIFREYPYFYIGDEKTETEYADFYLKSPNSFLILVKEGQKKIGLVSGIPLVEMDEYFLTPFHRASLSLQPIFYLGEILLLKEFRGRGIGYRIYQAFEAEVRKLPRFTSIAILRMHDPKNDPRKPKDYKSLDPFWMRLGYTENPSLSLTIPYQEIGHTSKTDHFFTYSLKNI